MMSRWLRALLIAASAAAAAALALNVLSGWKEQPMRAENARSPQRSREKAIDDLTEAEKQQLMSELGQHV